MTPAPPHIDPEHPPTALRERKRTSPWAAPGFVPNSARLSEAIRDNHCWICGRAKPLNTWVFGVDPLSLLFGRATAPPAHAGCMRYAAGAWGFQGLVEKGTWCEPLSIDLLAFPVVTAVVHYRRPPKLDRAGVNEDGAPRFDYTIDEGNPATVQSEIEWVVPGRGEVATRNTVATALQNAIDFANDPDGEITGALSLRRRVILDAFDVTAAQFAGDTPYLEL